MIQVGLLVKATAASLTATLAVSSATNIFQTFQMMQSVSGAELCDAPFSSSDYADQSCSSVLRELEGMKRKELLQVYMTSDAPTDLTAVAGDWNGILLDNNLRIMTAVSGFLTNELFGRGRTWNGKAFHGDSVGVNRFFAPNNEHDDNGKRLIETEHKFDYIIEDSLLDRRPSLKLNYAAYQFPLSLWRTMKDEMRLIPCNDGKVMIALGLLGWSAGIFNAQPFCLYMPSTATTEQKEVEATE